MVDTIGEHRKGFKPASLEFPRDSSGRVNHRKSSLAWRVANVTGLASLLAAVGIAGTGHAPDVVEGAGKAVTYTAGELKDRGEATWNDWKHGSPQVPREEDTVIPYKQDH